VQLLVPPKRGGTGRCLDEESGRSLTVAEEILRSQEELSGVESVAESPQHLPA
jgi:hypothetical protein